MEPGLHHGRCVLSLSGRVTMGTATAELATLAPQLQQATSVVVDGGALENFDSSAIAVLLELRRQALRKSCSFTVEQLPARLRDLMTLYGVGELLSA